MSKDPNKRMMPPVPRDHDDASMSELMPFRSTKIKLHKSPVVLFMIVAGLISVLMYGLMLTVLTNPNGQGFPAFKLFVIVAVFSMLLMMQVGIYAYSRTDRPIWGFMAAYVITGLQMATPIIGLYFLVFRQILPGNTQSFGPQTPFVQQFIGMLFGAGLMEELLKAVPMLIGAALTLYAVKKPDLTRNFLFKLLHIRGPLDAVVMGIFTGAAFIMLETAVEYVPGFAQKIAAGGGGYGGGIAAGMLLLLPRVMGGAVGHMAYSAIFGYFIGLAVLRRKKFWFLLGLGWGVSSILHALWNSVGQINPMLQYGVAAVCAVFAGAALLKARQIDASELGRDNLTAGSIIVDRPPGKPAPAPAVAPAYNAPPAGKAEKALALDIDGMMLPLRGGGTLDLGAEPALGGRGQGVIGQVVPHPSRANVLGLRNGGAIAWTARLRDGSQQVIEQNQNIRLAAGVQIDFGSGLIARVISLG